MAGDLGGSLGPGIVGRVTQYAGDNIRTGMGVGLISPSRRGVLRTESAGTDLPLPLSLASPSL